MITELDLNIYIYQDIVVIVVCLLGIIALLHHRKPYISHKDILKEQEYKTPNEIQNDSYGAYIQSQGHYYN